MLLNKIVHKYKKILMKKYEIAFFYTSLGTNLTLTGS